MALMSIAWALTSYHRSVRFARDDKEKIKWAALLVAFCWQLMSACEFKLFYRFMNYKLICGVAYPNAIVCCYLEYFDDDIQLSMKILS